MAHLALIKKGRISIINFLRKIKTPDVMLNHEFLVDQFKMQRGLSIAKVGTVTHRCRLGVLYT